MKKFLKLFSIIFILFLFSYCKKNKLKKGEYEIILTGTENSMITNQSISFNDTETLYIINSDKNSINFSYDENGTTYTLEKNANQVNGSISFYISSNNYHGYSVKINGKLKIEHFKYIIEGTFVGGKREYQGPGYTNPVDNPNYYTGTFIIKHLKK
ncbi:MAG: hypothetical protein HY062_01395 [Bacteroidetes bacterium]|nr:hypothetical protein [Bacteroidota bacterium]